jgi:arsenite oxidase small subunit
VARPGVVVTGTGFARVTQEDVGRTTLPYPRTSIAPLRNLKQDVPILFNYPDPSSTCVLLKMGQPVAGGIGPDQDIVAHSTLCTHMGCPVSYDAVRRVFKCPCHFSMFDPAVSGQMVCGQATANLPQVLLEHDAKDDSIAAVAVSGLIYGRQSNLL